MLLEGARSTYDLNRDFEKDLAERRKGLWETTERAKLLSQVRKIAGIRRLSELPKPEVEELGTFKRDGYRVKKIIVKPEEGIYLPTLMFVPSQKPAKGAVLHLREEGKAADATPGGSVEKLVMAGNVVLAVDLRGNGETHQTAGSYSKPYFGTDGDDVCMAYLLGRSYVGMRAEDVLVCANFLRRQQGCRVELIAVGNVSVPALHAAALEPDLFSYVKLVRSLISWSNVIETGKSYNQLVNTVHGALTVYDLPNLAATLGDKLTVEEPLNALGKPR